MIRDYLSMTAAATACTWPNTMTARAILANIRMATEKMEKISRDINGIGGPLANVIESRFAETTEPVRKHRKRRNQSESYHRRVQKKWVKRWGTKQVPCAYLIDNAALGGRGRTLVAHPQHMAALRNLWPNVQSHRDAQGSLRGSGGLAGSAAVTTEE